MGKKLQKAMELKFKTFDSKNNKKKGIRLI